MIMLTALVVDNFVTLYLSFQLVRVPNFTNTIFVLDVSLCSKKIEITLIYILYPYLYILNIAKLLQFIYITQLLRTMFCFGALAPGGGANCGFLLGQETSVILLPPHQILTLMTGGPPLLFFFLLYRKRKLENQRHQSRLYYKSFFVISTTQNIN